MVLSWDKSAIAGDNGVVPHYGVIPFAILPLSAQTSIATRFCRGYSTTPFPAVAIFAALPILNQFAIRPHD
jgi:hypothetical protein